MSREIKFKVWMPVARIMMVPKSLYLMHQYVITGYTVGEIERWIYLQFTGLKDMNGKEIYEGDVLAQDCQMVDDYTGKGSIEVLKLPVRWQIEKARWTVYSPSAMIKNDWGYVPNHNAYVIGNIYENPELLPKLTTT